MPSHKDATNDDVHKIGYASGTDPTTTLGASKAWHDTDDDKVYVRNAANDDWIELTGGSGSTDAADINIADAANDFTATNVEDALAELQSDAEAHLADASDAHDASAISILDAANDFTATNVEDALAELQAADEADEQALADHIADTSDAHDASAISILDAANDFTATNVEDALAELQSDAEDHLADTSDAHDASAISVADSGSNYAATDVEAALAEVMDALQAHEADTGDAHDASAISIADAGNDFTATDVEGALAELQADNEAHVAAADPHTGYLLESLLDAKGDGIFASADNTPAKVTVGADGTVLIADSGQSAGVKYGFTPIQRASSPPGSPSTGDLWYDTDTDLVFFYDGTRWLSVQLFEQTLGFSAGIAATDARQFMLPWPAYDKWLEDVNTGLFVAAGGTALSGSHSWIMSLQKIGPSGTATNINAAVHTINSGASDGVYRTALTVAIDALLGSSTTTYYGLRSLWTKTGTPGTLAAFSTISYRIVGA